MLLPRFRKEPTGCPRHSWRHLATGPHISGPWGRSARRSHSSGCPPTPHGNLRHIGCGVWNTAKKLKASRGAGLKRAMVNQAITPPPPRTRDNQNPIVRPYKGAVSKKALLRPYQGLTEGMLWVGFLDGKLGGGKTHFSALAPVWTAGQLFISWDLHKI